MMMIQYWNTDYGSELVENLIFILSSAYSDYKNNHLLSDEY